MADRIRFMLLAQQTYQAAGGTFIRLKLTIYIPIEYGISTINVYSYCYQGFSGTNQTIID